MPSYAGHFIIHKSYFMKKTLTDIYIKMVSPVILIIAVLYLSRLIINYDAQNNIADRSFSIIIFVLSAAFSIALPIFFRTNFVNKIKNLKEVPYKEFINFEKKIIIIALISPYFIPIAILFNIPSFYFTAIVLFAFYSLYYYYPSDKKIKFEKRLFRIKKEG